MSNTKKTLHLDDENFDALVLRAEQPVLVDFWAEWCPPCRALGPTIDALADQFDGQALVGKIDADQSPAVSSRYHVHSLPTLLLFVGGEPVEMLIGAAPKAKIAELIERHVRARV